MTDTLSTYIEFLNGVGTKKGECLRKEANIECFGDLLYYFPFRYVDKGNFKRIAEIKGDEEEGVLIKGRIMSLQEKGFGKKSFLTASLRDASGSIDLVWFSGTKWIKEKISKGGSFVSVFGKPNLFKSRLSISHPEINFITENELNAAPSAAQSLWPVYETSEKMKERFLGSKEIASLTKNLISRLKKEDIPECIPSYIVSKLGLMDRFEALCAIHFPKTQEEAKRAIDRCKFEELFLLQLNILCNSSNNRKERGFVFEKVGENFLDFFNNRLGFELTNAQKRVIREIRKDTQTGFQMNRLLQGDVGSGKTIVGLMIMLLALDNGFQSCIMAPTEILAKQHFDNFLHNLRGMPIRIALLTGSLGKKEKTVILNGLRSRDIDIVVGTHALLEDTVVFKNLGLAIIDEQHRFGVEQRSKLWKKNSLSPHVLVMTATPIPRTLSMTLYGDLDNSIIDELPPNRKAIETRHFTDSMRLVVFGFLKKEIAKGRQIYVVYPLIQESEALDLKNLMDGFEYLSQCFPYPDYAISMVHGKMKAEDKEFEMQRFIKGETQILVSTTVIEVGVNVPNASVMLIENSEHFGLSQLHQLRGRVGRGAEQSYCILMTADKLNPTSAKRIKTMCATQDGFKISQVDLELRGPGDLQGTQQSGVLQKLRIAKLESDSYIMSLARAAASEVLDKDPDLRENKNLLNELKKVYKDSYWSKIS